MHADGFLVSGPSDLNWQRTHSELQIVQRQIQVKCLNQSLLGAVLMYYRVAKNSAPATREMVGRQTTVVQEHGSRYDNT